MYVGIGQLAQGKVGCSVYIKILAIFHNSMFLLEFSNYVGPHFISIACLSCNLAIYNHPEKQVRKGHT